MSVVNQRTDPMHLNKVLTAASNLSSEAHIVGSNPL